MQYHWNTGRFMDDELIPACGEKHSRNLSPLRSMVNCKRCLAAMKARDKKVKSKGR